MTVLHTAALLLIFFDTHYIPSSYIYEKYVYSIYTSQRIEKIKKNQKSPHQTEAVEIYNIII